MGVYNTGDDGSPLQVHTGRVGSGQPQDPIIPSYRQNPALPKCYSLNDVNGRLLTIHGQHLTVVQHHIGVAHNFGGQFLGLRNRR